MLACQKPRKRKVEPIQVFSDGRETCNTETAEGAREYKRRTEEMRIRQRELCPICTFYLSKDEATFDHEFPRRMGGGFTDDRIWKVDEEGNKMPLNFAVHGYCNRSKGSQRLVLSRSGEEVMLCAVRPSSTRGTNRLATGTDRI